MERTGILSATTTLPGGPRVRLRLPHRTDAPRLVALLARLGAEVDRLEAERAVRFDPRARAVVCATVWAGGAEELAGIAASDLAGDGTPDTLVADEALAPGIAGLLRGALAELAEPRRHRAA